MPNASHLCRRGARYSYRRRLPVPFRQSQPITLSLGTADPLTARRRAAHLSVTWEGLVLRYKGRTDLTASEARQVFQDAPERELVRAIDPYLADDADKKKLVLTSKFWAGVYQQAQRPISELREIQEATFLTAGGGEVQMSQTAGDAWLLVEMLRKEVEEECPSALDRVGVPSNPGTLAQALFQRLRGRALAHKRVQLAADPRMSTREDLLGALLDEALIAAVRNEAPISHAPSAGQGFSGASIYLEQDTRLFEDIIDEVSDVIIATNDSN